MFLVEVELKTTAGKGTGVFTKQPIKKTNIVANFLHDVGFYLSEQTYNALQVNNEIIKKTACRWIGNSFLSKTYIGNDEYINHSEDPNCIYVFGTLIAKKNIYTDEELTVDYSTILSASDHFAFEDSQTGKPVDGLPWKEAMEKMCRDYFELIASVD